MDLSVGHDSFLCDLLLVFFQVVFGTSFLSSCFRFTLGIEILSLCGVIQSMSYFCYNCAGTRLHKSHRLFGSRPGAHLAGWDVDGNVPEVCLVGVLKMPVLA